MAKVKGFDTPSATGLSRFCGAVRSTSRHQAVLGVL